MNSKNCWVSQRSPAVKLRGRLAGDTTPVLTLTRVAVFLPVLLGGGASIKDYVWIKDSTAKIKSKVTIAVAKALSWMPRNDDHEAAFKFFDKYSLIVWFYGVQ